MKKILVALLCAFSLTPNGVVYAGVNSLVPVMFHVSAVDDRPAGFPVPKSPIEIPEASLDDHTLYIGTAFDDDVTVQLVTVDDVTGGETVEYSTVLYAGDQTVVFPSTLSGTYELRIIVDWYYLAGEVEL